MGDKQLTTNILKPTIVQRPSAYFGFKQQLNEIMVIIHKHHIDISINEIELNNENK